MTPVRLEPAAPLSRVKHSTTEPLHVLQCVEFKVQSYFALGPFPEIMNPPLGQYIKITIITGAF